MHTEGVGLSTIDYAISLPSMSSLLIALELWVSRSKDGAKRTKDYFLAGKTLLGGRWFFSYCC